mgnify:CR=1 FL=1
MPFKIFSLASTDIQKKKKLWKSKDVMKISKVWSRQRLHHYILVQKTFCSEFSRIWCTGISNKKLKSVFFLFVFQLLIMSYTPSLTGELLCHLRQEEKATGKPEAIGIFKIYPLPMVRSLNFDPGNTMFRFSDKLDSGISDQRW